MPRDCCLGGGFFRLNNWGFARANALAYLYARGFSPDEAEEYLALLEE